MEIEGDSTSSEIKTSMSNSNELNGGEASSAKVNEVKNESQDKQAESNGCVNDGDVIMSDADADKR